MAGTGSGHAAGTFRSNFARSGPNGGTGFGYGTGTGRCRHGLNLVTQDLDHLFGVALTEVAVFLRGEVHVLAIAQGLVEAFGRNDIEILGLLRKLRDIVVGSAAHAATQDFAREEWDVATETQVLDDVVVDLLDRRRPIAVTGVRFALVEDDALDNAVFLSLLGHFNQATVRVSAILINVTRHPALRCRGCTDIALVVILVEQFDAAPRNRNHNDTHLDCRFD